MRSASLNRFPKSGQVAKRRPTQKMTIEYESIPPGVEASELHVGEPVRLVRRGRHREGIIEGIQFALAPYGREKVVVRLDAGGRVHAIPEELEWIKRRKE